MLDLVCVLIIVFTSKYTHLYCIPVIASPYAPKTTNRLAVTSASPPSEGRLCLQAWPITSPL